MLSARRLWSLGSLPARWSRIQSRSPGVFAAVAPAPWHVLLNYQKNNAPKSPRRQQPPVGEEQEQMTETISEPDQAQAQAILNAQVPHIYANGFMLAQTNSDVSVGLLLNGSPCAILSMSFISAKSLIDDLARAIAFLERALDQPIPHMNDVAKKIAAAQTQAKAG